MSFGTKGCMYNCGDTCTGECMKPDKESYSPHIPTAEEVMQNHLDPHDCLRVSKCYDMTLDAMIEFAKLHVEAALKAASELEETNGTEGYKIYADSILTAYPLENII